VFRRGGVLETHASSRGRSKSNADQDSEKEKRRRKVKGRSARKPMSERGRDEERRTKYGTQRVEEQWFGTKKAKEDVKHVRGNKKRGGSE